jgi:molecular chaperone HscB
MQNHFELFQLPQQFAIDTTALDKAYREVQNQVHPDKFVSGSDAEKRVAMQWATRANEAYQTLRAPLRRASYLCELNGIDLQTESNTAMPMAFLMQQMEWREALDAARTARDITALEQLDVELKIALNDELGAIATQFGQVDFNAAAQGVRRLMFLDKLKQEIAQLYEHLED